MPDLVRWCLHSPIRFTTVLAVGTLLVGAAVWLSFDAETPLARPTEAAEPRTLDRVQEAAVRQRADRASARGGGAPTQWPEVRRAARSFLKLYLREEGDRRDRMAPALEQQVTPSLWRGLKWTDPAMVPAGRVASLSEGTLGAFFGEVEVALASGASLELDLVMWHDGWRVSDVRKQGQ